MEILIDTDAVPSPYNRDVFPEFEDIEFYGEVTTRGDGGQRQFVDEWHGTVFASSQYDATIWSCVPDMLTVRFSSPRSDSFEEVNDMHLEIEARAKAAGFPVNLGEDSDTELWWTDTDETLHGFVSYGRDTTNNNINITDLGAALTAPQPV